MAETIPGSLARLGALSGLELGYFDGKGDWVIPRVETVLAILPVLGVGIRRPEESGEWCRRLWLEKMTRCLDPVQTVWSQHPVLHVCRVIVQLEERDNASRQLFIHLETGEIQTIYFRSNEWTPVDCVQTDGRNLVRRMVVLKDIPWGVHKLEMVGEFSTAHGCTGWLIVAPPQAHKAPVSREGAGSGKWGIFLPTHSIQGAENNGCGNYSDLGNLIKWTGAQGGGLVGTLPLLATFTENPCEPSPYSPASRLFWNELYLDLQAIPEYTASERAKSLTSSQNWQAERNKLRNAKLVDTAGVMRLILPALELLADEFPNHGPRSNALREFQLQRPLVREYADFRAKHDIIARSSQKQEKEGDGGGGGLNYTLERSKRHRVIWQFWAEEQLQKLAMLARSSGGQGLYLDLPLGVNSDSFDVCHYGKSFAKGISAGAPPDDFFTRGQDWGFPPPHPGNQRLDGYKYLRGVLEHHTRLAGLLRIDHVMGMHRLYWIPGGLGPKEGAYIRYPSAELYAIYCLASKANQCSLAGEDLGTVPEEVRPAMAKHGIHRLFVGQFAFQNGSPAMEAPANGAIASLNTHDLPTFASYWLGLDIDDRLELGLIEEKELLSEKSKRQLTRTGLLNWLEITPICNKLLVKPKESEIDTKKEPIQAENGLFDQEPQKKIENEAELNDLTLQVDPLLVWTRLNQCMIESNAAFVLINAEDAWLETNPQNVPGTWKERPNWLRKAQVPIEQWNELPGFKQLFMGMKRKE